MTPETKVLIEKLAAKINEVVDFPIVGEGIEEAAIEATLSLGLSFLPPNYLSMIQSAADGIDDTEAASLTAWLTSLMDQYGAWVPAAFHGILAGVIVSLLRKGAEVVID